MSKDGARYKVRSENKVTTWFSFSMNLISSREETDKCIQMCTHEYECTHARVHIHTQFQNEQNDVKVG